MGTFLINKPFLIPKYDVLNFGLLERQAHGLWTSNIYVHSKTVFLKVWFVMVPVCELLLVHDEVSRDTVLVINFIASLESNCMSVNLIKK